MAGIGSASLINVTEAEHQFALVHHAGHRVFLVDLVRQGRLGIATPVHIDRLLVGSTGIGTPQVSVGATHQGATTHESTIAILMGDADLQILPLDDATKGRSAVETQGFGIEGDFSDRGEQVTVFLKDGGGIEARQSRGGDRIHLLDRLQGRGAIGLAQAIVVGLPSGVVDLQGWRIDRV